MAVTQIDIVQDNKVGNSNLLSAHNPVMYTADATYDGGTPPDVLKAVLVGYTEGTSIEAGEFLYVEAKFLEDISDTIRRFYLEVDLYAKYFLFNRFEVTSNAFVPKKYSLNDISQVVGTFPKIEYISSRVGCFFGNVEEEDPYVTSDIIFSQFVHASKQFGQYPNLLEEYNNESKTYLCVEGSHCYVYFYNTTEGASFLLSKNGILQLTGNFQSVGFYRYKTTFSESGTVQIISSANVDVTHTIRIVEACVNSKEIKYIDSLGQYRFYAFNEFFSSSDKPKLIGQVNKFVTNIRTSQSDKSVVGYENVRKMFLKQEVNTADLEIIKDINVSPRIYLRTGLGDTEEDWLEVVRIGGTNEVKRAHLEWDKYSLELELPKWSTVKMM